VEVVQHDDFVLNTGLGVAQPLPMGEGVKVLDLAQLMTHIAKNLIQS
jgi:hypothetical protein